jgi:hypothetical protein
MNKLVYIFLFSVILAGCEYERFETELNVKLDSRINNLSVTPTPLAILRRSIEDNLISSSYGLIDTIYTDEFGNFNQTIKLGKLSKNYFYQLKLPETLWALPYTQTAEIRSGIVNNVTFKIEPKWRHDITFNDSSGNYKMSNYFISNSKSKDFSQFKRFADGESHDQYTVISSAPRYSFMFVTLNLIDKNGDNHIKKEYTFNAEEIEDVWINF